MNQETSHKQSLIVGLGKTGLSVANYLTAKGRSFAVCDSRENPPSLDEFNSQYPNIESHFGEFDEQMFETADQLVVNPGLAVSTPIIAKHINNKEVIGDIELFAREVAGQTPVIAITGSNGKTTVTTLVDLMAQASNRVVGTGGNIGTPALDLFKAGENTSDLYVLELSSFQLETTDSLESHVAVILNISEDHLDRYDYQIDKYADTKAKIYQSCKTIIINRDDEKVIELSQRFDSNKVSYGLSEPTAENDFGVIYKDDEAYLAKGTDALMPCSELKIAGQHNVSNALAALALGDNAGLELSAMLNVLKTFTGMSHRMQALGKYEGVNWYNDSKGTNVGATLAALSGLSGTSILIAGGQSKGADFLPLMSVLNEKAKQLIVFGEDALLIKETLESSVEIIVVNDMKEAVKTAYSLSKQHSGIDNILLSPACASLDMYVNYEARGDDFIQEFELLKADVNQNGRGGQC